MPSNDSEWKKKLSSQQYRVLRQKGTEMPFTGKLLNNEEDGTYTCGACEALLFLSKAKYHSGSGWPSFTDAVPNAIELKEDYSFGMQRLEVLCKKCGSHLGHLFDDAPTPEGKHYCVNSCALEFKKKK